MIQKHKYILFRSLIMIFLSAILSSPPANGNDLSEKDHHEYILRLVGQDDKKVLPFTIMEMELYLAQYPAGQYTDDVQFKMGVAYEAKDKWIEAFCAYLKALHLYPESPRKPEIIEDLGRLIDSRGDLSRFKDRLPELVGISDDRTGEDKRYLHYLHLLAKLNNIKKNDRLLTWHTRQCQDFLARFPASGDCPKILIQLASLYQRQEMYLEADNSLMKIQYLYPDAAVLPQSFLKRGEIYMQHLDRPARAIDLFTQTTVKFPDSPETAEALFYLGALYREEEKDKKKALESLDKLIQRFPDHPLAGEALFEKGSILYKDLKDYRQALNAYVELHNAYPNHQKAMEGLLKGAEIAENRLEDAGLAARLYKTLADTYGEAKKAPEWLYYAGLLAEEHLGDTALARQYYGDILEKYPDSRSASKAQKRLSSLDGVQE